MDIEIRTHFDLDAAQQFADLLDRSFDLNEHQHFLDDFPVWSFKFPVPNVQKIGFFVGGRLICTAGARIAYLKLGKQGQTVKVAIIGAVATDVSFRGKGLASKAVAKAVYWAKERGAAAVFLWGSEHSLYKKLGFELCGQQHRLSFLSSSLESRQAKFSSLSLQNGWNDQIFQLIQKRSDGLSLASTDIQWYRAHKNVEWYYTGKEGVPEAYAALGRGIDLGGIIHEWGGDQTLLRDLLPTVASLKPLGASLLLGPDHLSVFEGMQFSLIPSEFLCLGKILNPLKFLRAFYSEKEVQAFPLAQIPISQLAKNFFGCVGAQGNLPQSLWFWGLDSA